MKLYAAHSCSILCWTYRNTNVSNWKIKWEKRYCFERLCLWYHPSQQETTCSKLATKHQNKVWKLLRIKHEDNGVAPVSSLLIVNIFPTCSICWPSTGKPLPCSYWKDKHFWRVYHVLCCSILKFINIASEILSSQPHGWISEKFLGKSLLQALILAKKMRLIFKMTCCAFVFFVKLIRSYLT